MPAEAVVDTSPLQDLYQNGLLDLLPKMFGKVIVPLAVKHEIEVGRQAGLDLPIIEDLRWAIVESPLALPAETSALGSGEAEAIAIAIERSGILVADDAQARAVPVSLRLHITGTLGILLRAKREGLVNEIKPRIDDLKAVGFRISEDLTETVLDVANEPTSV